ncbi:MAG: hypothetical protein AAFR38_02860 [Planctomycetota bacterium]
MDGEFVEQAAGVAFHAHALGAVVGGRLEPSPFIDAQETAFALTGRGGFLHAGNRVGGQAAVAHAPAGEGADCGDALVGRAGCPRAFGVVIWRTLAADVAFEGIGCDVAERLPAAGLGGFLDHLPRLGDVPIGAALGAFGVVEGVEVRGDGRRGVAIECGAALGLDESLAFERGPLDPLPHDPLGVGAAGGAGGAFLPLALAVVPTGVPRAAFGALEQGAGAVAAFSSHRDFLPVRQNQSTRSSLGFDTQRNARPPPMAQHPGTVPSQLREVCRPGME